MRQVVKLLAILFSLLFVNSCSTTGQFREIRAKAIEGDPVYQYNLGVMYHTGDGVPQDYGEAVKWYRKAAEKGESNAQNNLGALYVEGQGVPQDYVQAAEWYRKAAEKGHAIAQNNLGVMYRNGQGVPQDYGEAARWFKKAAENGHAKAQNNLVEIMHKEAYRTAVSKRDDQIKKIERYEVGKTTLSQFIEDGWNGNDPYHGGLGIIGYSIERKKNSKHKTLLELDQIDVAVFLSGYLTEKDSEFVLHFTHMLESYQKRINDFTDGMKGLHNDYEDFLDPLRTFSRGSDRGIREPGRIFIRKGDGRIETKRGPIDPNSEPMFSEYLVLHFKNGILVNKYKKEAK